MNLKKLLVTIIALLVTLIACTTTAFGASHVGVYGIKMIREGRKRL